MRGKKDIAELREHLHYLRVLQKHYGVYQEEIRDAIDYAISLGESCIRQKEIIQKETE